MKMENPENGNLGMTPEAPQKTPKSGLGHKLKNTLLPQSGDAPGTTARKIAVLVGALILIVALVVVAGAIISKYSQGNQNQNNWASMYPSSEPTEQEDPTVPDNVWVDKLSEADPVLHISKDFTDYYLVNPDIVGFLDIPGTKLQLPVVKGSDNDYYLNHTLEKTMNPFGVPYADFRTTFAPEYMSDNITIYGHAAADGSFFTPVKQYADIEFYKEHPTFTFDSIYRKGLYKVFAVALVNTDINNKEEMFNYHDYNDMSETVFNGFVEQVSRRAYYTTDVDVEYGDRIITLSTCDTEIMVSTSTPYRMVLFARRVRDGEVMDVNAGAAAPNKEMIMPAAWTKKFGKANPYA